MQHGVVFLYQRSDLVARSRYAILGWSDDGQASMFTGVARDSSVAMVASASRSRIPIYLLVDTSSMMVGRAIDEVRIGLNLLLATLKSDPLFLEWCHISVITYGGKAQQVVPLMPLIEFRLPSPVIHGEAVLGAALKLLRRCVDHDLVRPVRKDWAVHPSRADYRPTVIVMGSGRSADPWQTEAEGVLDQSWLERRDVFGEYECSTPISVYACAAGPDVDELALKNLGRGCVIHLSDASYVDLGTLVRSGYTRLFSE